MMDSKISRRLVTGILILQLTWVQALSGLGVLCVGSDGHVAFEILAGFSCQDADTHGPLDPGDSFQGMAHCGPCTDYILGDTQLSSISKARKLWPPGILALQSSDLALILEIRPSSRIQVRAPILRMTSTLLSTQLLC